MNNIDQEWLTLSQAAQMLGVHFTTLRRWANQGLIAYMRTPGGKRKFQRQAVQSFLERHSAGASPSVALVQVEDRTVTAARHELHSGGLDRQNWYRQMGEEERVQMRSTGSRLLALMFQYCVHTGNANVFLEEGQRIAEEYGRVCSRIGLSLEECIRTFMFFRRSMISSVHETHSLQGSGDTNGLDMFEKMVMFFDEVMVAMVVEYHRHEPLSSENR